MPIYTSSNSFYIHYGKGKTIDPIPLTFPTFYLTVEVGFLQDKETKLSDRFRKVLNLL